MAKQVSRKLQASTSAMTACAKRWFPVNRVTKVVKGGRILGCRTDRGWVTAMAGVGMGKGKSREVPVAVRRRWKKPVAR